MEGVKSAESFVKLFFQLQIKNSDSAVMCFKFSGVRYLASVAAKGKTYGKTVRRELCLMLRENNFFFACIGTMNF